MTMYARLLIARIVGNQRSELCSDQELFIHLFIQLMCKMLNPVLGAGDTTMNKQSLTSRNWWSSRGNK
jgi:hypothetical protein